MESKLSSNVADLSDEQRRMLESLIGQELRRDQVLYWLVVSPGHEPSPTDKAQARAGLHKIFARVDRRFDEQGTSPDEFTAAVDEAVRHVRSQPDA
jgi:hypothetical protein